MGSLSGTLPEACEAPPKLLASPPSVEDLLIVLNS